MRKKMMLALSLLIMFSATVFAQNNNESTTEFTVVSQNREVSDFQSIDISGRFLVKLYASQKSEVSVITAARFIENVETTSANGVLRVNMKDKSDEQGIIDGLKTKYNDYLIRQPIEIHIGVTNINIINIAGATTLETNGKLKLQTLYMSIGDASKVNLNVEIAKELNVSLTGASKMDVVGSTNKLTVGVHGACSLDGKNLKAKTVKVELSGAGRAEVHATEEIDADLKGASKLVCNGSPKSVKQSVSRASAITIR
ncbi:MAG TPA: DUF2807 domain-containing protein [Bacteroidales bacterium]|nr:DUF2807 domain-containing protein [Bacteroidales bacterium]